MPDYKVNFKELKARVGVTDVAYALGYRLDRKAGVGRYIEMTGVPKRSSAGTAPKGMYLRLSVRIWMPFSSPARTIGRRLPR